MRTKKIILVSSLVCAGLMALAGCSPHSHSYGDLVAKVEATCEESGHEAYYHCQGCGKYFNSDKQEVKLADLIIDAQGHDWAKHSGLEPKCNSYGYKDYYECTKCHMFAETKSGAHKFSDLQTWKETRGKTRQLLTMHDLELVEGQDADCLVPGWRDCYKCVDCDALFEDEFGLIKITNYDAWKLKGGRIEPHVKHLSIHEGLLPGCLSDGYKPYFYCKVCDKAYSDLLGQHPIADLDAWKAGEGKLNSHVDALSKVDGQPKTCTQDGFLDAYVCEECFTYYEDEDALTLIGDSDDYNMWKEDPLGGKIFASHELTAHKEVAPTGFKPGNTEYYHCTDCDKYFSDSDATVEIQKDSWIVPATGNVTFDSASQLENNTSKEGDQINLDKYGTGSKDGYIITLDVTGTHEGQLYGGYIMIPSIPGIKEVTIKGSGKVFVQSAVTAWAWETSSYFTLNETDGITFKLDPERTNAIFISNPNNSTETVSIKSLAIKSTLVTATGSSDNDLLQNAIINGPSENAYGYFTGENTNNSKSALVIGARSNTEGWPLVMLQFANEVDMSKGYLTFDAIGVSGRMRFSITPYDANMTQKGNEIGWDLNSGSYISCSYEANSDATNIKYLRLTVFTTDAAYVHENIIDNLRIQNYAVETDCPAWTYRSLQTPILETKYFNKAIALDIKPYTNTASFEVDYMSDNNHYVGQKNCIRYNNGTWTTTYGVIKENSNRGDGWYTLFVSEKNIITVDRKVYNSTINGIYLATFDAMVGKVAFDYKNISLVDDIVPTRREVSYTSANLGTSFVGNDVAHIHTVGEFKGNDGKAVMISFKVEGAVNSQFGINFANNNNVDAQKILAHIDITVTADGLSTNVGTLQKAPDGYYNLYIKNTDVDQATLNSMADGGYLNVFWMGGPFTVNKVTFDANTYNVINAGLLA